MLHLPGGEGEQPPVAKEADEAEAASAIAVTVGTRTTALPDDDDSLNGPPPEVLSGADEEAAVATAAGTAATEGIDEEAELDATAVAVDVLEDAGMATAALPHDEGMRGAAGSGGSGGSGGKPELEPMGDGCAAAIAGAVAALWAVEATPWAMVAIV